MDDFTRMITEGTVITDNYEIITITVVKPNFKKLLIMCVYKPPKGNIEKNIMFLKTLTEEYQRKNLKYGSWEILILICRKEMILILLNYHVS